MMQWIKDRLAERTSWDGGMLIAAGIVMLMLPAFVKMAAYAAVAYGLWTMWKKEK